MKKLFGEFKAFISRGNIIDLAVAVIIGNAFNKIVSSMVNDIVMPLITWGIGASSIAELSITLKETIDINGEVTKLTWNYGAFLQTILDFLIIAISLFGAIKIVEYSKKKLEQTKITLRKQISELTRNDKRFLKKQGICIDEIHKTSAEKKDLNVIDVVSDNAKLKYIEKSEINNEKIKNQQIELLTEIRDLLNSKKNNNKCKKNNK